MNAMPLSVRHQQAMSLVTRFTTEFLGLANMDTADATLHPEIKAHTGLKPTGPIEGVEEYKATIAAFVSAFPASEPLRIIDQFVSADGDRVVTRFQARLQHRAPFFGVKPSGRNLLFDETHVARLRDGKIVENIVSATNLEFEMVMAPVLTPLILGEHL